MVIILVYSAATLIDIDKIMKSQQIQKCESTKFKVLVIGSSGKL